MLLKPCDCRGLDDRLCTRSLYIGINVCVRARVRACVLYLLGSVNMPLLRPFIWNPAWVNLCTWEQENRLKATLSLRHMMTC